MNKVIRLLNAHAKVINGELVKQFPNAKEVTCVAISGSVTRSPNQKQQIARYSIEIEIIESVIK